MTERNQRLIGYIRVSTIYQQQSGLGLKAQTEMIQTFCKKYNFFLIDIYSETHTGGDDNRPIVKEAIEACKEQNANLIVAKIDRLSRKLSFIASFKEINGIDFYVANLELDVNKTMLYLLAIFAELERDMISKRVKEGISQKKRNGTYKKPSGNKELWKSGEGNKAWSEKALKHRTQIFKELEFIAKKKNSQEAKLSLEYYVQELNNRGNKTLQGKLWTKTSLQYLITKYPEERNQYNF